MSIEKQIRLIVGLLILLSVGLTYYVSLLWLWFLVFIGVNLAQSTLTGFCLMEIILKKIEGKKKQSPHPNLHQIPRHNKDYLPNNPLLVFKYPPNTQVS